MDKSKLDLCLRPTGSIEKPYFQTHREKWTLEPTEKPLELVQSEGKSERPESPQDIKAVPTSIPYSKNSR